MMSKTAIQTSPSYLAPLSQSAFCDLLTPETTERDALSVVWAMSRHHVILAIDDKPEGNGGG
jgi:hypothetical protein